MATAWISTNTELSLVNTISQNLTLFLPQNPLNGRNLFVKDAAGNSFQSTITLSTLGTDTFENGSVLQTLNSAYESIQLTYNSSKWYFTGGMMFNTLRVSTLQAQTTQTSNLSTLNTTVSSFQISDVRTSSIGTFNSVSSFLLYNGFNIGGGLRTAIPQTLNRFRFSVVSLFSYLTFWLDASDTTTVRTSGSTVIGITDKSPARIPMSVSGTPTYTIGGQNGLNVISVTNNGSFVTSQPIILSPLNQISVFVVLIQTVLPTGNFEFFLATSAGGFFDMYFGNGGTFYINTNNSQLYYGTNVTGSVNIYEFIYDGYARTSYLTGLVLSSATSIGVNLPYSSSTLRLLSTITGYLCEAMYFQRALSSLERQQTEGYLAWKWGIQSQLPANHPFKNAPPQ